MLQAYAISPGLLWMVLEMLITRPNPRSIMRGDQAVADADRRNSVNGIVFQIILRGYAPGIGTTGQRDGRIVEDDIDWREEMLEIFEHLLEFGQIAEFGGNGLNLYSEGRAFI